MRGDDQVVVLDEQVAHGGVWQVVLEGLPVVAVIEGNPDRGFSAGEEQALTDRVFANGVNG